MKTLTLVEADGMTRTERWRWGVKNIRSEYEGRSTALADDMRDRCDAALAYLEAREQRALWHKTIDLCFPITNPGDSP